MKSDFVSSLNKESIVHQAGQISGWYEKGELEQLFNVAQMAPQKGPFVEIGVFRGRTASLLSHFRSKEDLILCDQNLDPEIVALWPENALRIASRDGIQAQDIALLHVDGDHDVQSVLLDLEISLRLQEGGILAIHDFGGVSHPGVKEAWDHFHGSKDFESIDSLSNPGRFQVFRKKSSKLSELGKSKKEERFEYLDLGYEFPLHNLLASVVKFLEPKIYLEIGVQEGLSLKAVLEHSTPKRIALCDTWGSEYGGTGKGDHSHIQKLLKQIGFEGEVKFLDGKSQELIPTLREKFDLILIDGDHSESGAYTDLQQSWKLLNPGGIMVIDDLSHHAHPGIKKSFDRFEAETKGLKVVFEDLALGMGIGVFEKKKRASRTGKKRSTKKEV